MLHGDVSSGGPASDNVLFTQRIAAKNPGLAVAALIRLGYPDGADNASVGNNFNRIDSTRRSAQGIAAAFVIVPRAGHNSIDDM
jgi:hypothetical protein